ncbi:hypothetical protein [Mucilaginibacter sp.]|uniref:hypothetical protein n=1 Tax=Mucilaginibacter sp. TaxID=1882438 RepID=UPI00283F7616|nr:hypothetical protein [Mucilaginibacter sp.]MDR3695912.1 hypothetical protein [Mucilaginibacter sp.]
MNKIKLADLDQTYGSIRKIREHILESVPENLFLSDEKMDIVYHTLKEFNFKKAIKWNDLPAIEKACVSILNKTGWYINGKLDPELRSEDRLVYDPITHYFEEVLGFTKLPVITFRDLEIKVRLDLRGVLSLIERYENKEEYVRDFLETGVKRGEHEGKIRLDFYERCRKERDEIVKHLSKGLVNRAIYRSRSDTLMSNTSLRWFEEYRDRPYQWGRVRSIQYFDYEKIDVFRHRIDDLTVRNIRPLEKLYNQKKYKAFYKEVRKYLSPDEIFNQIFNYYIPRNLKVLDRKPVFEELAYLLKKKRWYGFTALALTQVEGIFSDMLAVITPKTKHSSLSNKVFAIRPYFNYYDSAFDYFEYILPRVRNRFLHSGTITGRDFEIIAYDLLYDLHFLLKAFLQANDNQIKLMNMLNEDTLKQIGSIHDFLELFKILDELQKRLKQNPDSKELAEILFRWTGFEQSNLKDSGNLEHFAGDILNRLNIITSKFYDTIFANTAYSASQINLAKMTSKEVRDNIESIKEILKDTTYFFKDQLQEIVNMHNFLKLHEKHLPSFPTIENKLLKDLLKNEKNNMNVAKLNLIAPIFELKME